MSKDDNNTENGKKLSIEEKKLTKKIKMLKRRIKNLKKTLVEKDKLVEDYLSQLKYLKAEFDNYRKMMTKERELFIKTANEQLIIELIDVYENLERGLNLFNKFNYKEEFIKGMMLTYDSFKKIWDKIKYMIKIKKKC